MEIMRYILSFSVVLASLLASSAESREAVGESGDFRIMTYNIWGDFFGNPVPERKDKVSRVIRKYAPHVIALQEVTPNWWKSDFLKGLSDAYGVVGDGWEQHNPNPILYDRKRLKPVASGRFVYHFKLDYSKGATWCVLEDRESGRRFLTFSTHYWWKENGAESEFIREYDSRELISHLEEVGRIYPVPVIGGGDFNSHLGTDALNYLSSRGYREAWQSVADRSMEMSWHADPKRGEDGGWHGVRKDTDNTPLKSLDHVFSGPVGVSMLRQRVVLDQDALDASDHLPVVVDFRLVKSN